MPEVEYFVKSLDAKRVSIAKFIDGNYNDVYTLESSADCNCRGAIYHRTQCKHMRIRIAWESLGRPQGYFTMSKKGDPIFHATVS